MTFTLRNLRHFYKPSLTSPPFSLLLFLAVSALSATKLFIYTSLCFISPSGNGLKVFVEVSTERRIYRPKANSIEFEKATPQIPIVMLN